LQIFIKNIKNDFKKQKSTTKISGEFLGKPPVFESMEKVVNLVKDLIGSNCKVAIVVGGGNIIRGRSSAGINRVISDQMGMLATIINSLAIKSNLENSFCVTSIEIPGISNQYFYDRDIKKFNNGEIPIFGGGIGLSHFSTDTGCVLRAIEMECDVVLKMTNVEGIFDSDPRFNENAKLLKNASYEEIIEKKLNFMDMTSICLAMENRMPIIVFSIDHIKTSDFINGIGDYSIVN
jgi:uridylate kinase